MKNETLYKYFAGEATAADKEAIKAWLDENPVKQQELINERQFFNMVILTGKETEKAAPSKRYPYLYIIKSTLKIASIIALAILGCTYYYSDKIDKIATTANLITVPPGQRVNLVLPDNTNVWLNAGSRMKYPAYFTGNLREVELEGEAFFEVSPNAKKPFIVRTSTYDVEVLGTSFNIESYADKGVFSVALMTGLVKVSDKINHNEPITLEPGRQVRQSNGRLVESRITDYEYFRWQEGLICFKDMAFVELMQRFEKCYDVKIIINNPTISDIKFSGKFRISDGIDNALRIIQKDARYKYEKNNDGTVIYIN